MLKIFVYVQMQIYFKYLFITADRRVCKFLMLLTFLIYFIQLLPSSEVISTAQDFFT